MHSLQTRVWADVAFAVVLGLAGLLAHLVYEDETFAGPVVLALLAGAVGLLARALTLKVGLDLTPRDED